MSMQPESAARIWDAAQAARAITRFIDGRSQGDFLGDLLLRSAVERQLEILGEALKLLRKDDPATIARVPEADRIIGMRNVIAHEYGEVDYDVVWSAITRRVPRLVAVFDELLGEIGPAPDVPDD